MRIAYIQKDNAVKMLRVKLYILCISEPFDY